MIKAKFTYASLRIFVFTAASLFSIDKAAADNIDHFSFCSNTCKTPHCDTPSIKDDCKKRCTENDIWKRVATDELSQNSKEFQAEKNETKREMMLLGSKIAKCLDLKVPVKLAIPLQPGASISSKDDLCEAAYAAVRAEMKLGRDQAALKVQEQEIDRMLGSQSAPLTGEANAATKSE